MWDEEMVTDPNTGGRKIQKLARFDLLPTEVLTAIAEHFGRGANKYEDRNWEKGYKWSLSYAAAMRHLTAFWGGEDYDPEFEDSHHLDAAMFHLMALREFFTKGQGTDDRASTVRRLEREEMELTRQIFETYRTEETDPATTDSLTGSEQAERERRLRPVQTRRWEIP